MRDGAARLKFGSAAASCPYPFERRGPRTCSRCGSVYRKALGRVAAPSGTEASGANAPFLGCKGYIRSGIRPEAVSVNLHAAAPDGGYPYPEDRRYWSELFRL